MSRCCNEPGRNGGQSKGPSKADIEPLVDANGQETLARENLASVQIRDTGLSTRGNLTQHSVQLKNELLNALCR